MSSMSRQLRDHVYVNTSVLNLMFTLFNCYPYLGLLPLFNMYHLYLYYKYKTIQNDLGLANTILKMLWTAFNEYRHRHFKKKIRQTGR